MFLEEAAELFARHPWLMNQLQRINFCGNIAELSNWMETRVAGINELRAHLLNTRDTSHVKLHKTANDHLKILKFRRRKHLSLKWTTIKYTIIFREELTETLHELTDHFEQKGEKHLRFGTFYKVVEYGRSVGSTIKELRDWAAREEKNIRLLGVIRCVETWQNGRLNSEYYDLFPADENMVN